MFGPTEDKSMAKTIYVRNYTNGSHRGGGRIKAKVITARAGERAGVRELTDVQ